MMMMGQNCTKAQVWGTVRREHFEVVDIEPSKENPTGQHWQWMTTEINESASSCQKGPEKSSSPNPHLTNKDAEGQRLSTLTVPGLDKSPDSG